MRIFPPTTNRAEIERLLREEVSLCHAPVTGIFVASAIYTDKAIYLEHNYEFQDPVVFEHSETRSLKHILTQENNPKIHKILLSAGGNANKFKSYVPCYNCATILSSYIQKDASVSLLELPNRNNGLEFSFEELLEAYKSLPFSEIKSNELEEIKKEIEEKTELRDKDLNCISTLTKFGKENNIGIYLTGSSTKRGGAGTMLNKKSGNKYRDIDILFVANGNTENLEKYLEDTITSHYEIFTKRHREIPSIHNPKGVVFKKYIYSCGKDLETTIDCAYSTNFEGTLAYHAYELKNWFHKLA